MAWQLDFDEAHSWLIFKSYASFDCYEPWLPHVYPWFETYQVPWIVAQVASRLIWDFYLRYSQTGYLVLPMVHDLGQHLRGFYYEQLKTIWIKSGYTLDEITQRFIEWRSRHSIDSIILSLKRQYEHQGPGLSEYTFVHSWTFTEPWIYVCKTH